MKNKLLGTVRWFDSLSGEGMVRTTQGNHFMHFTAIKGINKNNHQWPLDSDRSKLEKLSGQSCVVTVDQFDGQIVTCEIVKARGES